MGLCVLSGVCLAKCALRVRLSLTRQSVTALGKDMNHSEQDPLNERCPHWLSGLLLTNPSLLPPWSPFGRLTVTSGWSKGRVYLSVSIFIRGPPESGGSEHHPNGFSSPPQLRWQIWLSDFKTLDISIGEMAVWLKTGCLACQQECLGGRGEAAET